MEKDIRDYLKKRLDEHARQKKHGSLDPEALNILILDAESKGLVEIAHAFRNIRTGVNFLLGEGYSIDQIEDAFIIHLSKKDS